MALNKVFLQGNLTRDPELRYIPSGTAVADFAVAVNNKYKTASGEKREDVLFMDCTAWAGLGETIQKFFAKGDPIIVEGSLRTEEWKDKDTGAKRSKIKMTVSGFNFVGGGKGKSKPEGAPEQGEPQGGGSGDEEVPF